MREDLELGIGSYRFREQTAKESAIDFISKGNYSAAIGFLTDAMRYEACAKELMFQLELMEVEDACKHDVV